MRTFDKPSETVEARRVPEAARPGSLPKHFKFHLLAVEATIYGFMGKLAPDYDGGLWVFYEISNGGFYMAPDASQTYRIRVEGTGFDGILSADAAGIVACLFALSHLSFRIPDRLISRHFHLLRELAATHAEAGAIFSVID